MSFSPCVAAQGGVWMARDEHTLVLIGGPTRRTIRLSGQGSLQRPLSRVMPGDCAEDSRGRLWADQVGGLHLLAPGPQRPVPLGEDSGFQVLNMVAMEDGTMAAYIGHGSLWRTDGTHSVKLWDEKAITLGSIEVMVHRKGGLLLGGDRGIARYDGHGFATLTSRRFLFLATTTGIAQTAQGDTWLQSSKGVIQLKTADLDRAFDDPAFVLHPRIFTMDDGLPGAAAFFNLSNVNADRFGHVWVTTDNGIARHDPGQRWNPAVPPVLITGLTDGNDRYAPRAKVALPPGAGRIRIDFTALSFADPARMQFRYRMLGVDPDWVDPRGERSASYIGLAPGTYRFQVIAANNEGVWNRQGATIELMLAPRVWQTWWFRAACAALGLGLIWALYRWRMHALARRLREQAAQRAHERERVARDIHDTLLQSIQGLVLRFQSIAARMMPGDPHRALIETTLDRADEVIAQGKERVLGLRDDDQPVALPEMIRHQLGEAPFALDVDKAFTVLGAVVPVQTWVAVEIREIVGEALFNAARHARATRITLDLVYGGRMLEVVVEDNGIGIDREAPGATTGFGMTGMRGRALGIGGTIAIAGAPTGGTRVHLRVPARRAYVLASLWRLLRRR